VFLSLLAAVRAVVVPALGSSAHFHSPFPLDTAVPQTGQGYYHQWCLNLVRVVAEGKIRCSRRCTDAHRWAENSYSAFFSGIWSHFSEDVFGLPSPDNLVSKSLAPVLVFFTELSKGLGASKWF
jgi:hypothetical protein